MPPYARTVYVLCALTAAGFAEAGPAINQFEVKDLEVEVGRWEFQSQNAYSWKQPDRQWIEEAPGEFAFDDNTVVRQRYALELEIGVSERFRSRIGIELEQERFDEPVSVARRNDFDSLELEELALEAVWVFVPVENSGVGLGLLAEYQYTLKSEEPDSLVLGPIVEAGGERWTLLLNPALVQFFGGSDDKLDFTYAAQLGYSRWEAWIFAIEAYGTIDRLGNSGSPGEEALLFGDHDLHRVGPIAYFQQDFGRGETRSELRLGIGFFAGVNDDTPDATFKLSIEYEF